VSDDAGAAVAAAGALAPLAAEHAAASERARTLARPVVDAIAEAGLFRLCVPGDAGGLEAPPSVLVEAAEAAAVGDGAAGWCVAINATSGLLMGYLPLDAVRTIFDEPTRIAGGVFAPRGRGTTTSEGLRVTGRWPFASGCRHSDWLMGGTIVDGEGPPRLCVAPSSAVTIHDTWHVSGLRGTGSHDIEMDDVLIPLDHAGSVFGRPVADGPLYAFPLFGLLAIAIAGVGLGIGRGALDDLRALAAAKTPEAGRRTLAQRGTVQAEVARAEAALRAARAGLLEAVGAAWDAAVAEGRVSVEHRTALRLAATHAAVTGAAVADAAYRTGGGTALYETSPLQRRFRDANAVTQHMLVAPATWELTGRLLLGVETDVTQL
jgi:alkylation response protein AidB-like acyl-CoA dehydrogenase